MFQNETEIGNPLPPADPGPGRVVIFEQANGVGRWPVST